MDITTFIQQLTQPFAFEFMQRATLAVVLIGIISGLMGAFVVTRGMAFLGDALAHTILPGVAVAYLATSGNPQWMFVGGLGAGVLSALGISWLSRDGELSEDTAIGIVFAGALALGIAIISSARDFSTDLSHILIGNILAVNNDHILQILIAGGIIILVMFVFYREFLIISFDPILARTLRLRAELLRTLLLVLLAVTVVINLQAVGVAMVAAMLVTPAATARLFVKRFHHLMFLAAAIGALGAFVGMYLQWYLRIAPSAAIVLTLTAFFIIALLAAPQKGILWRRFRKTS